MSNPRRRDETLAEDVPNTGECVLLDKVRGRVLALNPTAAAVWELLDGTRDAAAIAAILAEAGGVTPEQARTDVDALLEELETAGFLDGSGEAS